MAKLIQLSENSWQQPFLDRKKELKLWRIPRAIVKQRKIKDGKSLHIEIKFENKFKITERRDFHITSGKEIYFPVDFRNQIQRIILDNPKSYFVATILR